MQLQNRITIVFVSLFALGLALASAFPGSADESASSPDATRPKLRIAINPGVEPMGFVRDGELVGYDIDLGEALGERLGRDVEWVVRGSLSEIAAMIHSGDFGDEADLIVSAMGVDLERTRNAVAVPYFKSGLTILTTPTKPKAISLESLTGLRVASVMSSTENKLIARMGGVTSIDVQDYRQVVDRVLAGEADAAVLDLPVALLAAKRNPERLLVAPAPFEEEWYGVYLPKGESKLFLEVRRAVRALREAGRLDEIYERWF